MEADEHDSKRGAPEHGGDPEKSVGETGVVLTQRVAAAARAVSRIEDDALQQGLADNTLKGASPPLVLVHV